MSERDDANEAHCSVKSLEKSLHGWLLKKDQHGGVFGTNALLGKSLIDPKFEGTRILATFKVSYLIIKVFL